MTQVRQVSQGLESSWRSRCDRNPRVPGTAHRIPWGWRNGVCLPYIFIGEKWATWKHWGNWWCEKYIFNRPVGSYGLTKAMEKTLTFSRVNTIKNDWCSIIMLVYRSVTMFLKLNLYITLFFVRVAINKLTVRDDLKVQACIYHKKLHVPRSSNSLTKK